MSAGSRKYVLQNSSKYINMNPGKKEYCMAFGCTHLLWDGANGCENCLPVCPEKEEQQDMIHHQTQACAKTASQNISQEESALTPTVQQYIYTYKNRCEQEATLNQLYTLSNNKFGLITLYSIYCWGQMRAISVYLT